MASIGQASVTRGADGILNVTVQVSEDITRMAFIGFGAQDEMVASGGALVPPDPAEVPPPVPPKANSVKIKGSLYPLSGVDIERGANQLVAYLPKRSTPEASITTTNQWGTEVVVVAGKIVLIRDREPAPQMMTGTPIPQNGYVLSGNNKARDWLNRQVGIGVDVELTEETVPVPPPAAVTAPTVAIYMMDRVGSISQIPPECDQIRVAFLQKTGLVEWGGDSPAKTAADLTGWRAANIAREVVISAGGQDGAVDIEAIPATLTAIARTMPIDGLDWDIEAGALNVAQAVRISKACAENRPNWLTCFTPPGGPPVALYLEAAAQVQAAGLRVQFAQQLYDTEIKLEDVMRQMKLAVDRLGAPSVLLGCMVGDNPLKYSTVAQWISYMRAVKAKWPDIGGAFLWESSRAGTTEWAKGMRGVLGSA